MSAAGGKGLGLQECSSGSDAELSRIDIESGDNVYADSEGPPSTLYDPAALTLDPKYKAEQEAKEAQMKCLEEEGVLSPKSPQSLVEKHLTTSRLSPNPGKNPFDFEDNDALGTDIPEVAVCCCGILPLKPAIIAVNVINMILGIVVIGIGVIGLYETRFPSAGFSAQEALLISGPFITSVVCVVLGLTLTCLGIIGIASAKKLAEGSGTKRKAISFLIYQSFSVLILVIVFLLGVLNAVALSTVNSKDLFDQPTWQVAIQEEPQRYCNIQSRLKCSGFREAQCAERFNTVAYRHCPGHFCVDFCKVGSGASENSAAVCDPCRRSSVPKSDFVACLESEINRSTTQACGSVVNQDLTAKYSRSLVMVLLAFVWMIVSLSVASFTTCCTPHAQTLD